MLHQKITAPELISDLKSGGHIIYMRHGITNHNEKDTNRNNMADCSRQRNLSNAGKQESIEVGKKIKAHNIPIHKVTSSPYCRCKETAQLVFGDYEIDTNLSFSISKDKQEAEKLGQYLYQQMLQLDISNGNVVFVGHTSNLKDGLGIWPKPEGVAAIFKQYNNQIIFKGFIKPSQW